MFQSVATLSSSRKVCRRGWIRISSPRTGSGAVKRSMISPSRRCTSGLPASRMRPAAWGSGGECPRIPAREMNHWRSEDLNHTADCVAGRPGHCRLCDGWCGGEQLERSAGAPRHSDRRGSRKIHKVRSPRTFTNPCQSHSWELTDRNPEILEPLAPHRRCDAAPTVQEFWGFGRLAPRSLFRSVSSQDPLSNGALRLMWGAVLSHG